MSRWLVSVPAWGERCVDVFCATALPALERAMVAAVEDYHAPIVSDMVLVVHTDQPKRIMSAATQIKIEPRPVPAGLRDFDCLSQAHREVISLALRGDVAVLLTADLVLSERGLLYCAEALSDPQKMLVACAGVRALQEGRMPDTTNAQVLMRWAWDNRHPITEACRWPGGNSADLSRVYFEVAEEGEGELLPVAVSARLALPHPLAVRIDGRPLRFSPTIDANLIQCFEPHEIHMATDCRELALVELSPRDKDYQRAGEGIEARLRAGAFQLPDPMQRHCFGRRVTLVGKYDEDCGDRVVVDQVLGK